ncbi:MAG: chemotaxis-specific protein-glutamate methyltransferase CheB [Desulfobacca sp.]|uniref:chemotaxis-specific protein-glutamate methyltransferase CheB n=1 Tax=Desulfobacca sp. TaxID=2067990 RepID=UPI00404AEFA1
MIKVLVADDSAVARDFLAHLIDRQPDMQVVGKVPNGAEAVAAVKSLRPHIVVMDSNMPILDGFRATRQIMEEAPTPIVIVTASLRPEEVTTTFKAVEAGALAVLAKPVGLEHPHFNQTTDTFVQTIRLMSEIKVVRRRNLAPRPHNTAARSEGMSNRVQGGIVAIGASTGGPQVIQTILSLLEPSLPAPVLIVQHISPGFVQGFVDWLAKTTKFPVKLATAEEKLHAGQAYIAPDGVHLGVQKGGHLLLSEAPPENGLRPAVSFLFRSVAAAYGRMAVGVLLSGMGRDGAAELKLLRETGAVTIAQDQASAVIFGMPGEAVKLGAAAHVVPPEEIARIINATIYPG